MSLWQKIILLSLGFSSVAFVDIHPMMIYGEDNRQEIYQVQDTSVADLAESVAVMMSPNALEPETDNHSLKVVFTRFGNKKHLCPDERFYDQVAPGNCTAFLVAPDVVATAGHCADVNDCDSNSFVFGFRLKDQKSFGNEIESKNVYHCKKILVREVTKGQDYGLIQLDRIVEGHAILKLAQETKVQLGDSVFVIGYPAGLPEKYSDGAAVRTVRDSFFSTNLDTFGGSSGSPVFDQKTHEVIGVLVRGDKDYEFDLNNNCNRTYRCSNEECRGEDATHISFIKQALETSNKN